MTIQTDILDKRRERAGLLEKARDTLRDLRSAKDDAELDSVGKEHDALLSEIDLIDIEIAEMRLDLDDPATSNSQRPNGDAEARGSDCSGGYFERGSLWQDEDGNPIRVAGPKETYSNRQNRDDISLGDYVRATITGPRTDAERRALGEGSPSAGGFTVPAPLSSSFIDRMRAETVAIRAGALTVPMTSQTLAIARLENDPSVEWREENAAIAQGDPTFGRVAFQAKSCAGMIRVSRELMADTINAGSMIEQAFAAALARKLDHASIWSDGAGSSPTGVVHTPGVNSVSMGADGAVITNYDPFIDAVYSMHENDSADPTAMAMHPRTLSSLAKLKDGNQNPLAVPEMIARIPRFKTTAAPIDETQGAADDASSVVLGDYSQLMIGIRDQVSIRVYDQPFAQNGQLAIVAWMRADVQLAQPKSFSVLKGILPPA